MYAIRNFQIIWATKFHGENLCLGSNWNLQIIESKICNEMKKKDALFASK